MLDRRDFLKLATTAAATAAAGCSVTRGNSPEPVASGKRSIKKSLMIGMVEEQLPLADKFTMLRDCGFDGVELDSPCELTTDEVLRAKEKSGLEVQGIVDSAHWRDTLSHPDPAVRARGRAALEHALDDCKAWGATSVLLVPAVVNKEVTYDQAWERSTAEIRGVIPRARELGVRIAVENVWNQFLLSPLEAARFVDQFDARAVGWHFDIGNVVNYGWPEQWIRILGKRILKLHIKEFSRKKRDAEGLWKGFDVELGEGDVDWPAVMTALDEVGYSGWGSAEVRGGDRERLRFVAQRMDRLFAS